MVSIYTKPYTGYYNNVNGVYNGLPFVLDSDMKSRGNFRYIAEIYVAGKKVAELRHSPDVSAARKGVFDIARIVENYLAADPKFDQLYQSLDSITTAVQYYVEFGEEYSRMQSVLTTVPYSAGGGSQFTKFNLTSKADMSADGIIIGGSSKYNGWWMLNLLGPEAYGIGTPFNGETEKTTWITPTYKGREISSVDIDGTKYMTFKIYRPTDNRPRFQVGNRVVLNNFSNNTPISPFYTNSEWTIMKVEENQGTVNGNPVDRYTISAPYKYTVPSTYIIQVASYDNIVYKNQLSTATDRAYALNLARQYEIEQLTGANARRDYYWFDKYKVWTPAAFNQIYTPQQYCSPLTDKPGVTFPAATDSIDICWGETYQLSWAGRFVNGQSANKAIDNYMRLETWSAANTSFGGGTWQVSMGVAQINKTLTYVIGGNLLSQVGVGDYVTANVTGLGTFAGRIVSTNFSGGFTYIFTDIAQQTGGPGTMQKTISVKYYDTLFQPNAMTYPCGTWNLKGLTEINDMTCYKYMVYPIKVTNSAYFYPTGGVGNFDTVSNGINFKGRRDRIGQMTTFNIKSCCETVQPYKVAWLNKDGGFDFYKFSARVDKKLNIERTEFYQKMGKVQGNNYYAYRPGDKGRTNWNTTSIESWVVNSDWLTQKELDWLTNLYESPEVYLIQEGRRTSPSQAWVEPVVIPLNIRNTEVELHNKSWKNTETGRMYRYVLEFESAKNRIVQRGGRPATLAYKSIYE